MDNELLQQAEDAQCEALCQPDLHEDGQGGVICTGCGVPVWLVLPESTGSSDRGKD
jgi:hypothetical protein